MYSLELPRGESSNEYPQSMFLSRNKKDSVYSCKPQLYTRFKQTSTKNSGPGSLLMQVLQKKVFREKYEIPRGLVSFEPTPATTAAPTCSPSESGDITTAPLRLLKNMFHGTVLCLISLNDPSDRIYFGALVHSLCRELSGSTGYRSLENIIIIQDLNKLQQRIPAQDHY